MKFVAMRELRNDTSKVLKNLKKEGVVITRNGKPAALLTYLNVDMLEEFVLTHGKTRVSLEKAKKDYFKHGGISHAQMKKKIESWRG